MIGLPLLPAFAHSAAKAVGGIICLVISWRMRRTSPELGAVLAIRGLTIFAAPSRS